MRTLLRATLRETRAFRLHAIAAARHLQFSVRLRSDARSELNR
jgi:hypothetical protein